MARFSVDFLGCKVSHVDVHEIRERLLADGHVEAERGEPGDVAVINTCCVTNEAVRKSRHAAARAARTHARVYVTGCAANLAGEVSMHFSSVSALQAHIKSGRLKALGVTNVKRSDQLPDVPTMAEAGLPGYEATAWYGIVAPSGTPREIVQKLNAASLKAIKSPEVAERLAVGGGTAAPGTPEQFSAFIRSEIPRWAKVVKQAGAKVD